MSPALAIPNVGAEESDTPSRAVERVRAPVIAMFRDLVERERPVFDWLPRGEACVAWLNTPAAAERARALGRPLFGAAPEVALRCHDKAFAQAVAEERGLQPPLLRARIECWDSDDLSDSDRVRSRLEEALARTPEGLLVKPRLGTSGRGHLELRSRDDLDSLERRLPRLRRAGGVVVEPRLDRALDLAALMYVGPSREITLVGTAELIVDAGGTYRGHRGRVDARGRVSAGGRYDEALREAAVELARAASEQGYTGPCGVDGLVFHHQGRAWLRPIVELNARFTLGTLMVACIRDRLSDLRECAGLRPDRPLAFHFELHAEPDSLEGASDVYVSRVLTGSSPEAASPRLIVSTTRQAIDAHLTAP